MTALQFPAPPLSGIRLNWFFSCVATGPPLPISIKYSKALAFSPTRFLQAFPKVVSLIFPRVQFKGNVSVGQMGVREKQACQEFSPSQPSADAHALFFPCSHCSVSQITSQSWPFKVSGFIRIDISRKGFIACSDTTIVSDLLELHNTDVPTV